MNELWTVPLLGSVYVGAESLEALVPVGDVPE
jgi:hypothetical protein